MIVDIFYVLAA